MFRRDGDRCGGSARTFCRRSGTGSQRQPPYGRHAPAPFGPRSLDGRNLGSFPTPMNRPRVDVVLRSGVWICSPDVVLACSRPTWHATYRHELLSLCHILYRRGGGREVRWELTGPRKATCRLTGTPIIGMTRVVVAAGVAGAVASRPRRGTDRSITLTCAWRFLRRSRLRRSGSRPGSRPRRRSGARRPRSPAGCGRSTSASGRPRNARQ